MTDGMILHANKTYWTHRAPSYSEGNRSELSDREHRENWLNTICHQIDAHFPEKNRNEIRLLEVGCGPGFFAILLSEAGYDVTAIDLTPNMLREAKKNAGVLAERIHFCEMNAEALDFPSGSFDVVTSRNLTWNLPHPETAYGEWRRVLKKDGLLLNFDANWYAYLYDEAARDGYLRDRENTAAKGFADQNIGENFDRMEEIARQIPLSSIQRPAWDLRVLKSLGMRATAKKQIWQQVWSEEEKTAFASTPMFLIKAIAP